MDSPVQKNARGFTLFEVLAAALILVIVGTLSFASMNADLGRMGDARRQLEAGRLADLALADLEATLFDGSAPEIQSEVEEQDGFVIKRNVTPLGLLFAAASDDGGGVGGGAGAAAGTDTPGFFPALVEEFPGLPKHLRVLHVKVEWGNPTRPRKVERTSIAFDQQAALEAFEQLAGGSAGESDS